MPPAPPRMPDSGPPTDRYQGDVLARARRKPVLPELAAEPGLVVEDVETGWVGAVVRTEKSGGVHIVVLEDRRGRTRRDVEERQSQGGNGENDPHERYDLPGDELFHPAPPDRPRIQQHIAAVSTERSPAALAYTYPPSLVARFARC